MENSTGTYPHRVIDADAHMHEPQYLWERYVEKKFRDRVPKVAFMDGTIMVYEPDGNLIAQQHGSQKKSPSGAFSDLEERYGDAYREWWSPEIRLKDMDRFGWDIQVLLPTGNNGNFAYRVALKDAELGAAMCRAYNNWASEYCSVDKARLKFVALLPGSDVIAMAAEAQRAVGTLGAVSVRNPLLPEGKWLHEEEYKVLWEIACDLDFPISIHGEYRDRRAQPFHDISNPNGNEMQLAMCGLDHALGFPMDNMAMLGYYIFSGILDRYPKLRLGVLESNLGWLPFWLDRMDNHTHGRNSVMGNTNHRSSMLPSEVFKRQCTIACDSDESALKFVVERLEGNNIVWNSDYPHPDAIEPADSLPQFHSQPISQEDKAKILWDNSIALFGSRLLGN